MAERIAAKEFAVSLRFSDHSPVIVAMALPRPVQSPLPSSMRWDYDAPNECLRTGLGRVQFINEGETMLERKRAELRKLEELRRPDEHVRRFVECLCAQSG